MGPRDLSLGAYSIDQGRRKINAARDKPKSARNVFNEYAQSDPWPQRQKNTAATE
jgi:hypothetical protein